MESNKEEALNCITLAQKAESEDNLDKAIRFVNKSIRLYATAESRQYLTKLEEKKDKPNANRNRNTSSSHSEGTTPPETSQEESDPQKLREIDKILKCRNLYDLLNVSRDATTAEIKKQYRNLSLKFHPDKCKIPRSTEAFKAISKAFTILSDDQKRKHYDVSGDDTDQNGTSGMHGHFFAEEMDPFDLFASMFSGEMDQIITQNGRTFRIHSSRGHRRGFTRVSRRNEQEGGVAQHNIFSLLVVLLPVLLFIIFPILNSLLESFFTDYYLEPKGTHHIKRNLYNSDRHYYYVKPDFTQYYTTDQDVAKLEYKISSDLLQVYSEMCHREEYDKRIRINSARFFGSQEEIKKSQNIVTHSCAKLRDLRSLRSRNHR